MPRDSNGTYTLPAGNPVVTLTVISSTWANTTLSDVSTAMTASLSRSGQGAMLAALKLFDGAIGAPGLTWGTETTSGFYRAAAGDFRFAIGGVDVWSVGVNGVGFANGTAALPSIYFASDPNTGIYRIGADNLGITAGGVLAAQFSTSAITTLNGTAALPSFSFISDPDTGIYRFGANALAIAVAGVANITFAAAGITAQVAFLAQDGTVGAPGLAFSADPDTGIYRSSADNFNFSTGGTTRLQLSTSALAFQSGTLAAFADGTVGAPGLTFNNDSDTGLYRIAANRIGLALGGINYVDISSTFAVLTTPQLIANGIHNGTAPTGAATQYIASGTYTPTLANVTNTSGLVARVCQWIRVGNVVTVSGSFQATETTGAAVCEASITLPIASDITLSNQLGGSIAGSIVSTGRGGPIDGNASTDTADARWLSQNTNGISQENSFTFTYLVN